MIVVGLGIPEIDEIDDTDMILLLKAGNLRNIAKLVPYDRDGKWTMFGGNFAYTSDSRFSEAVSAIVGYRFYGAVPIHDRIEF